MTIFLTCLKKGNLLVVYRINKTKYEAKVDSNIPARYGKYIWVLLDTKDLMGLPTGVSKDILGRDVLVAWLPLTTISQSCFVQLLSYVL